MLSGGKVQGFNDGFFGEVTGRSGLIALKVGPVETKDAAFGTGVVEGDVDQSAVLGTGEAGESGIAGAFGPVGTVVVYNGHGFVEKSGADAGGGGDAHMFDDDFQVGVAVEDVIDEDGTVVFKSAAMDTGVEEDKGTELSGEIVEGIAGGIVNAEFHDGRMGFDANESLANVFLEEGAGIRSGGIDDDGTNKVGVVFEVVVEPGVGVFAGEDLMGFRAPEGGEGDSFIDVMSFEEVVELGEGTKFGVVGEGAMREGVAVIEEHGSSPMFMVII
jgi:hypothetical protein